MTSITQLARESKEVRLAAALHLLDHSTMGGYATAKAAARRVTLDIRTAEQAASTAFFTLYRIGRTGLWTPEQVAHLDHFKRTPLTEEGRAVVRDLLEGLAL